MHSSLVPFWFYKRGKDKDVVLGSKILVIRNVRDYLFPEKMTIKEGIEFKEKFIPVTEAAPAHENRNKNRTEKKSTYNSVSLITEGEK